MVNYTKEDLEQFNIYELRYVAQKVGVRRPTNKRKETLINDILNIQNNIVEPYYAKRGRPSALRKKTIEFSQEEILKFEKRRVEEITKKIESYIEEIKKLLAELKA